MDLIKEDQIIIFNKNKQSFGVGECVIIMNGLLFNFYKDNSEMTEKFGVIIVITPAYRTTTQKILMFKMFTHF